MEATGITHAIFSSDWAQPSWLDSFAYPKTRHRSQGNGLVGLARPRPRLILETGVGNQLYRSIWHLIPVCVCACTCMHVHAGGSVGSLDAAQPKISPSQFLC